MTTTSFSPEVAKHVFDLAQDRATDEVSSHEWIEANGGMAEVSGLGSPWDGGPGDGPVTSAMLDQQEADIEALMGLFDLAWGLTETSAAWYRTEDLQAVLGYVEEGDLLDEITRILAARG
jgi:hypothetical protein